jgi:hypothetical protein
MASCRLSSVACVSSASSRKDAAWAHPDFRPFPSPYTPTPTQTIIRRVRQEGNGGQIEEVEVHERGGGPRVLGAVGLNRRTVGLMHDPAMMPQIVLRLTHCLGIYVCMFAFLCLCVVYLVVVCVVRGLGDGVGPFLHPPTTPQHPDPPRDTHTQTRHTLGQLALWQLERSDSTPRLPSWRPSLPRHSLIPTSYSPTL